MAQNQNSPLRLGIAGLGTVGVGVIKIVEGQSEMLTARAGRPITISAVCAQSRSKDRGVDLSDYAWQDNPIDVATHEDVDVYVELMGGEDGIAKASVEAALNAGKHVVTANKALLAHHGQELAALAESKGVSLRYEAAVAGGIPIIKALGEGLAANKINRIMGVMNGTCNYILTRMESAGLPYAEVFEEANQLGYLEADPNLDVGGIDAGHKLALLSSLAFGTQVNFAGVALEGIQNITSDDIQHTKEMGFRIKLLGLTQMTDAGLEQSMRPSLVPASSPLGQLEGGTNMVVVEGDAVGQIVMRGAGAGEGPTASAVMGDMMDIARGVMIPTFGQPANTLKPAAAATANAPEAFYIRMIVKDEAGAMAGVSTALAEAEVSIDRMRQKEHADDGAPVVIVTHPTNEEAIKSALGAIKASGILLDTAVALPIVDV
jgi:homoserine dehydrogenase